jgi:hypothetical protein
MIYFRETQRFQQPWYWAIQIPALAALAYILFRQLVLGKPVGNHQASNTSLAIIALTLALFRGLVYQAGADYRSARSRARNPLSGAVCAARDSAGGDHAFRGQDVPPDPRIRRLGRSPGSRRNGL